MAVAPVARGVVWEFSAESPTAHSAPAANPAAKVDPGIDRASTAPVSVIIQAMAGQETAAAAAVQAAGGKVGKALPVIDGFEATVTGTSIEKIAGSDAVKAVTANRVGHFADNGGTTSSTATASNFVASTGAANAWSHNDMGEGIGVAVIDTGVSAMNDLSPRVVYGPDLSGEGTTIDSYGHGTVMAGIIAGSGADSASNPNGGYTGIAPHAHIISVKTAGYNGAADVSTVLQAMHWVAAYKSQFNIRVLNLSWGTPSTQSPTLDPLNFAVERLWNQGIVVVVAAGNSGPANGTIMKPGDDPLVITAGAYDDNGDLVRSNDYVPDWSSKGPTAAGAAKPDLVAPGRTLIATRSYGSNVEFSNPTALVAPSYIKGSGTSEATAVTAGAAALVLAVHPNWTPYQVKTALTSAAVPMANVGKYAQGNGRLNVTGAINSSPSLLTSAAGQAVATGLGSIEASRGGHNVVTDCNGVSTVIQGEIDVRCEAWNGSQWAGSQWNGSSWTGSSWTGGSWTGGSWTGGSWTGGSWTGGSWTGSSWTGSSWTGGSWTGSSWTGSSWTGSSWTGSSWTGGSWTGSSWTGSSWTGGSWTGGSWTGGSWTGGSWTSAGYGDTNFLNAFWGDHPRGEKHLPGEITFGDDVQLRGCFCA